MRPTTTTRNPPPASTRIVLTAWSSRPFRASSKARDGEEQIEVDECAGEREEDLLDEVGGYAPAKVQARMMATNMSSVTKVPMFAGRKLFIATPTA